uniref:HTH_48 domain-containing protein n=1 Tax=Heterorhabditis bacteriophora TaxID=37862 RepID=A0A1I7XIZ0_HETBA
MENATDCSAAFHLYDEINRQVLLDYIIVTKKLNSGCQGALSNQKWKKEIRAISIYESKMERKVVKTVRNINQAFGEGIVNKRTARHCFRRFRNGERLEGEDVL